MRLNFFARPHHRKSRKAYRGCRFMNVESLEVRQLPATFLVTTTADSVATNLTTGTDATGQVSLRSAVMAANRLGGAHTILLQNNVPYSLSLAGLPENISRAGDLDVTSQLTISTIDPTGTPANVLTSVAERIFEVRTGGRLELRNLAMMGSVDINGGVILNSGQLLLDQVQMSGTARGQDGMDSSNSLVPGGTGGSAAGGAIFNGPGASLQIVNSSITGQAIGGRGGDARLDQDFDARLHGLSGGNGGNALGGAIYNLRGSVSIIGSTINGQALAGHGGRGGNGSELTPWNQFNIGDLTGDIAPSNGGRGGNGGLARGGAIYNDSTLTITVQNSPVTGIARSGWGGIGGKGSTGRDGFDTSVGAVEPTRGGTGGDGGNAARAEGGAVFSLGSSLTFSGSDVSGEAYARVAGAGNEGGQGGDGFVAVTLVAPGFSSFINGKAGGRGGNMGLPGNSSGGAIHLGSGSLSFTGGTVTGTAWAESSTGGGGGGVGGSGGYYTVNNQGVLTTYVGTGARSGDGGNAAAGGSATGGAIAVIAGSVNISQATLNGYAYAASGGYGGSTLGATLHSGLPGDQAPVAGIAKSGGNGGTATGGIVSIQTGTVLIFDSTLNGGLAVGGGGGLAGGGNIVFSPPSPGIAGAGRGGAIAIQSGTLDIQRTTIDSNRVEGGRGGSAPGQVDVFQSLIVSGRTGGAGAAALGGGIAVLGGNVSISQSTVSNNHVVAGQGGAGGAGSRTFGSEGQIIEGAAGNGGSGGQALGGGIYSGAGNVGIVNSTIHGNAVTGGLGGDPSVPSLATTTPGRKGTDGSGRGGGILQAGTAQTTLNSVTIARNRITSDAVNWVGSSSGFGAGIRNEGSSLFRVFNTIISLNTIDPANSSLFRDVAGVFTSLGYNLVSIVNGGSGFTSQGDRRGNATAPLDVKLGELADNGGSTKTCLLLVGSPAKDRGALVGFPSIDQRGLARPRGLRIDIGAIEA